MSKHTGIGYRRTAVGVEVVNPADRTEIERLAAFLMTAFPDELGKCESPSGESAVDMAIRLLRKMKV